MSAARTASERRDAGEAEHCACGGCVIAARVDMQRITRGVDLMTRSIGGPRLGMFLRALVIATLLDPATYARAEGWRP